MSKRNINRSLSTHPMSVSVYLVHGEGVDHANCCIHRHPETASAFLNTKKKGSKKKDVDPNLTANGYKFAADAWKILLEKTLPASLGENDDGTGTGQIFVFSSPLKRTIGTVMMLAEVSARIDNDNEFFSVDKVDCDSPKKEKNIDNVGLPSKSTTPANKRYLSFPLPVPRSHNKNYCTAGTFVRDHSLNEEYNNDRATANIVILNGLSAPALDIVQLGGITSAISKGMVDCAAAVKSSSSSSSIKRHERIQDDARDGKEEHDGGERDGYKENGRKSLMFSRLIEMDNTISSSEALSTTAMMDGDEKNRRKTRFWRENDDDNDMFIPMTDPLLLGSICTAVNTTDTISRDDVNYVVTPKQQKVKSISIAQGHPERDTLMGAVNRAAYLTANAGGQVCIIVTHRESINKLAVSCGYKNKDLCTPYYSIGKFVARVALPRTEALAKAGAHTIKWAFYGVDSYDKFSPVPFRRSELSRNQSQQTSPSLLGRVQISLSLSPPNSEHRVLGLLAIPIDSCSPSPLPISLPNDLVLSGYFNQSDSAVEDTSTTKRVIIPLDILHGQRKLANFYTHLRKENILAWGKFTQRSLLPSKGQDIVETRQKLFVIDPKDQPSLPSPPNVIYGAFYI